MEIIKLGFQLMLGYIFAGMIALIVFFVLATIFEMVLRRWMSK